MPFIVLIVFHRLFFCLRHIGIFLLRGPVWISFINWIICSSLHWCKLFRLFVFFVCLFFGSSYRQTRDGFDWNRAVHCTPGCWMPPTCWKRNRQEGKSASRILRSELNLFFSICLTESEIAVLLWVNLGRYKVNWELQEQPLRFR